MKLKIEIAMDNNAFEEDPDAEVRSIVEQALRKLALNGSPEVVKLLDNNGNVVGTAKVVK